MIKKILLGLSVAPSPSQVSRSLNRAASSARRCRKLDFPAGYNTVTAIAEIPAGGTAGRHTHPGVETGYLLEGEPTFSIEGKPRPTSRPGDSYQIPAGAARRQSQATSP